jgi:sulfite reductase (NADPH) flavoprotein alpha-component
MGNIVPSAIHGDEVQGVLHTCDDDALPRLDALEARGVGYDRIEVVVTTAEGPMRAQAYVGRPEFLDDSCLPTRRYRAILLHGAVAAGLDASYIRRLTEQPLAPEVDPPAWQPPSGPTATFTSDVLARHPELTALAGAVFDMSHAAARLESVKPVLGARDTTLFHLHRHDSSDGTETLEDFRAGRVSDAAQRYINAYLHEYATEFRFAGRLVDP